MFLFLCFGLVYLVINIDHHTRLAASLLEPESGMGTQLLKNSVHLEGSLNALFYLLHLL